MNPRCSDCGAYSDQPHRVSCPTRVRRVERDEMGNRFTRMDGKEYAVGTLVVTHKDGQSTRYANVREDSIEYADGVLSVESGFSTHHIVDVRSYTFDFS